jgi:hypothetical protein
MSRRRTPTPGTDARRRAAVAALERALDTSAAAGRFDGPAVAAAVLDAALCGVADPIRRARLRDEIRRAGPGLPGLYPPPPYGIA